MNVPSCPLARTGRCVYTMCMPRIQVYLPDDLHRAVKRLELSPSELLQKAVRSELERRDKIAELDRYIEELEREVPSKPTPEEKAHNDALLRRIERHVKKARKLKRAS
jgi:hypothetical protein